MLTDARLLEVAKFIQEFTPELSVNRASNYCYTWKYDTIDCGYSPHWVVYFMQTSYPIGRRIVDGVVELDDMTVQLTKIDSDSILDKEELTSDSDDSNAPYFMFMGFVNEHERLTRQWLKSNPEHMIVKPLNHGSMTFEKN